MKKNTITILLILLSIVCQPTNISAQQTSGLASSFTGKWTGYWTSPKGYLYLAQMELASTGNNVVEGKIDWTLVKSPPDMVQTRLGLKGTEFIKGSYYPASRIMTFEGTKKNDPDTVIGLDKYKLILAENDAALGGITWNHGSWDGLFGLTRSGN